MDTMGIQMASMAMSQTQLMNTVRMEVLSMSLDHLETAAGGMVDMMQRSFMENSVSPNLGGNIDIMV